MELRISFDYETIDDVVDNLGTTYVVELHLLEYEKFNVIFVYDNKVHKVAIKRRLKQNRKVGKKEVFVLVGMIPIEQIHSYLNNYNEEKRIKKLGGK